MEDRDIGGSVSTQQVLKVLQAEASLEKGVWVFPLAKVSEGSSEAVPQEVRSILGRFLLTDRKGRLRPARLAQVRLVGPGEKVETVRVGEDGFWNLTPPPEASGLYQLRFRLDNSFWSFQNPSGSSSY